MQIIATSPLHALPFPTREPRLGLTLAKLGMMQELEGELIDAADASRSERCIQLTVACSLLLFTIVFLVLLFLHCRMSRIIRYDIIAMQYTYVQRDATMFYHNRISTPYRERH